MASIADLENKIKSFIGCHLESAEWWDDEILGYYPEVKDAVIASLEEHIEYTDPVRLGVSYELIGRGTRCAVDATFYLDNVGGLSGFKYQGSILELGKCLSGHLITPFENRQIFPTLSEAFEHFWEVVFLQASGVHDAKIELAKLQHLANTVSKMRLDAQSRFSSLPRDIVEFCVLPLL